MKFIVTGGGGYIGIPLISNLAINHEVVCLDRFFFGEELVSHFDGNKNITLIKDDIRWFDPEILDDVDVVLDLASISNDPASELNPSKTLDINYLGRTRVATLAKLHGVKRYILASSCSVYGFNDSELNESSDTNPLTTYSKAAIMAENDILKLSDTNFTVVIPRFATVYGLAPRMRFDLAINAMIKRIFETKSLGVMRDGTQWRPFIDSRQLLPVYLMKYCHNLM